jgi:hypothetical protein
MNIALGVVLVVALGLLLVIPPLALQLALRAFAPRSKPRWHSTGGRAPGAPAQGRSRRNLVPFRAAS